MTTRPKLLITRRLPDDVTKRVSANYEAELNADDHVMTADELLMRAQGKDALLVTPVDKITPELVEKLPASIKMIATFSVGFEHINVPALKTRSIKASNTPDVLTDATADLAMGLILDVMRRLSEGDRLVRRGGWTGWSLDFMLGSEVRGKQLGIVGAGRIGRAVARRALAMTTASRNWQLYSRKRGCGATFCSSAIAPLC